MSLNRRSAGIATIEVVLMSVAVILVGVAGYAVFTSKEDQSNTATSDHTQVPDAPAVDNTDDLNAAEEALDKTDIDATTTDRTDIDSQVNAF